MRRSKGNQQCWANIKKRGENRARFQIGSYFELFQDIVKGDTLFETCLLNLNELRIIHLKPLLIFLK
jgi:hypothetical protein